MQLVRCTFCKYLNEELEVKPVHELNLFEIKVAGFCLNELDIMDNAKYSHLPITNLGTSCDISRLVM